MKSTSYLTENRECITHGNTKFTYSSHKRGYGYQYNWRCNRCMSDASNRYNQKRHKERKLELIKYKGNKCEKCGYNKNYAVLQFHHLDPLAKEGTVSNMIQQTKISLDEIKLEVDKCILVCSNCHDEIHNPSWDREVI